MPPQRCRIDQLQDDIWRKNKTTLRRLFLNERRTLKDVKKAMESEHGFPVTPLSTYESKLRDLGLRKKMKRTDWHPVYQHYVNSGNRHTVIYFNGTRIPWEKAWKEIRRSGARESIACHTTELPVDVIMRSLSPVLGFQSVISVSTLPVPWHLSDVSLETLSPAAVVYRSKLYEIPSNLLRIEMHNNLEHSLTGIPVGGGEAGSYHNVSLSLTNPSIEPRLLHQSSTLSYQGPRDTNLISDIDRLSTALYRLANGNVAFTRPGKPLDESLEVILNLTPKQVLLKILAGDSPIIRAALETLLDLVAIRGQKDGFLSLVKTTRRLHPKWRFDSTYLKHAMQFGCINSCLILSKMTRFTGRDIGTYSSMMWDSHFIKPHTTLLKPKHPIVNKIFYDFLKNVAIGYHTRDSTIGPLGLKHPAVLPMLYWFFELGANVDLPAEPTILGLPAESTIIDPLHCHTLYTPEYWMPTILDHIYFLNSELYSFLIDHSIKSKAELTRSGVHHSAKEGTDSLCMYLLSRPSDTPAEQETLVDILLIEECLRSKGSDFETIRTLLDYSLSLQEYHLDMNASAMLYHVIDKARNRGMHPAVHHIVSTLIQSGATIVAETMGRAVEYKGTTLLQLLSSHGADFKSQGALALCKAAQIDNYDAVNWLLNMGIDINSTLLDGWTILARANMKIPYRFIQIFDHGWLGNDSEYQPMGCKMLEYLISRNFELRANDDDTSPRRLLCLILEHGPEKRSLADVRKKIQLILDAEPLEDEEPGTEPCPFEVCLETTGGLILGKNLSDVLLLMNDLLDYGVSVRHSGVLAPLLKYSAPSIDIQRVLDEGADIDTYCGKYSREGEMPHSQYTPLQAAAAAGSLDWVRFLIQRGADVNAPTKGNSGRTALQAACGAWDASPKERSRRIELIKLLIATGADVNAPPARAHGATAFQTAAMRGDFEVALLLLDNGADINAPPAEEYGGFCALDGAVYHSKLDMVQFLLNLGALSHDMGESGYRGAIKIAEERRKPAITDLIRRHAPNNGKSGEELSADWDYTLSEHSSEAYDTDETDETDNAELWDQTGWEDWLP
ncbi:hypothetical protein NUW58_g5016 [Xylaria curta]|uniref:Uncharacterized protein n=1 Tax=Xylaria curta TaxID=42375 RepID=A0ACC1P3P3_9PEZI|nr:hypothetical protein NUW58_g5016 [Xylaria curta]